MKRPHTFFRSRWGQYKEIVKTSRNSIAVRYTSPSTTQAQSPGVGERSGTAAQLHKHLGKMHITLFNVFTFLIAIHAVTAVPLSIGSHITTVLPSRIPHTVRHHKRHDFSNLSWGAAADGTYAISCPSADSCKTASLSAEELAALLLGRRGRHLSRSTIHRSPDVVSATRHGAPGTDTYRARTGKRSDWNLQSIDKLGFGNMADTDRWRRNYECKACGRNDR